MSGTFDAIAEPLRGELVAAAAAWDASNNTARLWKKDASLWTSADESKWLGWLSAPEDLARDLPSLQAFGAEVRSDGLRHVLLLGMGGSSLCPEVLSETFGQLPGGPRVHVLDSTDPAQVAAVDASVDLSRTLVIVASKSGSTLEPNIFHAYFYQRMVEAVGAANAGRHFIAITDPGSKLEAVAARDGFRRTFAGVASIGGRYSALSPFGTVPAAAMGLDLGRWHASAAAMADACRADRPAMLNPGVSLGLLLGSCAVRGVDKLTLIVSPRIYDLGAWLEQLIAESTGKNGRAIIPVDRETLQAPSHYSTDRDVCVRSTRVRSGGRAGCRRRGPGDRGTSGRAPRRRRAVRAGGGVLPLGDRDGRRRVGDGHQPVRSAGRRGQQDRNAQADDRLRGDGPPARRDARRDR